MGMGTVDVGGVPAVITGGGGSGCGDMGMGGMGGGWMALILVMILLGGAGAGGFGGQGNVAQRVDFAEINGRLDALSAQVGHNNDLAELRALYTQACATDMNVTQQAFNVSNLINQSRTDTLLNFKDLALQNAQCCCETQRSIDGVRYQQSQDTCAIINAGNQNTQKIIDTINSNELMRVRDELNQERLANSQCAQNAYLIGALKPPCPIPAYAAPNPYETFIPRSVPFVPRCGGGCGGGFGFDGNYAFA